MGKAIGIDLGTTNSVMAIKQGIDVNILLNKENEEITKSAVGFYKNQIIVGGKAIDKMASSPEDTIISIKRLMGRAFNDPEVEQIKKRYEYKIVPPQQGTKEDIRVILGGKEYSPIDISSIILKKLKEDAELRLNDKVEYAIITIPAYFTEKQRDATRKAGQKAGLKVQKILDEPTAAAIAFGVDNIGSEESKTILVYDLGGGTFDVSIITIVGGVFAQLDIEGNMWLGGDDFDHKIMDYVIEQIKKEYDVNATTNQRFLVELKKQAEKAKKDLSSMNSTEIVIIGLLKDDEDNLIDVEVELSRKRFEEMISDKIQDSIKLVKQAIKNANLTPEQIDNILLVGGSSSIPLVRRSLIDVFGESKILMNVDPMKCVAQGSAVLAARTGESIECPNCKEINPGDQEFCIKCGEPLSSYILGRVTGQHYGIQTKGDNFEIIIEKGSAYPTPEPIIRTFYTSDDNLRRIKVPIYCGSDKVASKNEIQQTVWLQLPPKVPKGTPVDVSFELDDNGILSRIIVSLKDGSGRQVEVFPSRGGERQKIEQNLESINKRWHNAKNAANDHVKENIEQKYDEAINYANENDLGKAEKAVKELEYEINKIIGQESKPEWKRKGENLVIYSEVLLSNFDWLLKADETYQIKKLAEELKQAIEDDLQKEAEQKYEILDKKLDELPDLILYLMAVLRARNIAINLGEKVIADKLLMGLKEILDDLKKGDGKHAWEILDSLAPLIEKVINAPVGDKGGKENWDELLEGKAQSVTTTRIMNN